MKIEKGSAAERPLFQFSIFNFQFALSSLIVLLFLLPRLALLFAREPFFDELFTVWMAQRPFGSIVPALMHDSGPPLYYFVARVPSVFWLRVLSLLFASVPLVLILSRRSLGNVRFVAATLLALFPPAALFAVDARGYALCAMFVALGIFLLESDRPFAAAFALAAAAYSHYYGVLFFFTLLRPRTWVAFPLACLLFMPGLLLAMEQPKEATGWFAEGSAFAPLGAVLYAGDSADALFAKPPMLAIGVAGLLALVALTRSFRYAPYVLVPIAAAIVFHLAGRPVYFPMRFESVLAVPLVLWMASSLERWGRHVRRMAVAAFALLGAFVLTRGIQDHLVRDIDPYRRAANVLRVVAKPEDTIVATGYLYLETAVLLDRPILPFPPEQGLHPGWRTSGRSTGVPLPDGEFLWIGERAAPELAVIRAERKLVPIFMTENAMVAKVAP